MSNKKAPASARAKPQAEAPATAPIERPRRGGSFVRDPQTGTLALMEAADRDDGVNPSADDQPAAEQAQRVPAGGDTDPLSDPAATTHDNPEA